MRKKEYIKPIINFLCIEIEESIANSSATITIGGQGNEVLVEEWVEKESEQNIFFD